KAFEKRGIKTTGEAIRKARQAITEKILGGEKLDPISKEVSDDLWREMGGFGTDRLPKTPWDEMPGFGREGFTARGTIPAEVDDYWNILGRREPPDLAGREHWEDVFGYRRGPAEEYMDIAGRGEGRTLGGTLDAEIEGFGRTGRPEPYGWPEMRPPDRGPAADYMGVFGGEGKALRGTVETAYEDLWDVFGRCFVGHEPNVKPDKASVVLDPGRFPVHRVAVKDIGAIPESLQFKLDVNAEGIQKQLAGEWNDLAAGNLLLWESRDGKLYVANGHHRLELAKRLGVKEVNAQIIREADGFDVNAARKIAAESNILEGKGTIYDHAEFFRQNRGSYDPRLSERKGLVGRGFTIGAHASDDTYAQFRNRKISPDAAEAVSAAAPGDEALQRAGVKFALENGRAGYDEISHFVKALKTAPRVPLTDQPDMFGFDDSAIERAKTLAKAVSKIVGDLREDLNAVLGAAKRPERAKKLGVNVKDPEAVRAKIEDLRGQLEDWSKWYVNEDLVKKAHEAAGLKAPDPASVADDIRRYHIRRELFDELEDLGRGVATFGGALERAGGVKTLGVGIRRDLIRSGSVNLRGQVVETAEDLAAVAQVYRDPRYETLHIVYLKGNRIVGHEGYTSRMPGFAAFPLRAEKAIYEIQSRAGRLGADGFYLLHNHPGGAPSPSAQDLQFSRLFKEKLAKIQEKLAIPGAEYKGHVVIDSGKYGFIHPETHIPEVLDLKKPAGWTDELLSPEKEHHLLGIEVSGSESLARLGAILRTPREFATLLYLDARNRIRAIQAVPNKLLNNYQEASNYIRGRTREFGASRVVGYTDDAPSLDHAQVNNLIYNNTLTDMAYADPRMQRGWSTFRDIVTPMQGWIAGRPASAYYRPAKVGEEIAAYKAGQSPSVRLPDDFMARASAFLKDRRMNLAEVPELEINWNRIETPDDVRDAIDGM
ncbi:MAG TPA: JAB domain-containing protein, partial [Candidatus Aminicenantes bacterium]|nr:JAB domain-containing protein [Candidatus Aminicenantes bacterium]